MMSFLNSMFEQITTRSRWGTEWPTVLLALLIPVCLLAVADRYLRARH